MNLKLPRLNNATTFRLLRQLLKGNKVEQLNFEAEIIEVPSDGMYKKHAYTGRKTVTITVVPR